MKIQKIFIVMTMGLLFFAGMAGHVYAKKSFEIAATVNKDAISMSDVNDRISLVFASSGVRRTRDSVIKAQPQALNSLIDEQLRIQEAERQNLPVTDEEVTEGFVAMAAQNNMKPEQFDTVLKQQGIPKSTLLRKIKSQIAWRKIIKNVLRPQIDVTETDVRARLDRMKENIGKMEYKAFEIFLPVTNSKEEKPTKDLANKLISEIRAGSAPFSLVAAQFSKSASGPQGGGLGWVQEGQLPQELNTVLKSLSLKQVSSPIRGLSGFHILMILNKRTVSEDTLPSEEDILNAIGLERLDRLQQRYLSDIRSSTFIDRR